MIVVFGHRLFGKVDAVPGLFHVATKFFYIDYLPLIPAGTWLVFSQNGKSWRGVPIPFSIKSMLVAWARAAVILGTGIFGILIVVAANSRGRSGDPDLATCIVGFVVSLAALIGGYFIPGIGRATPARLEQLCIAAGLSQEAIDELRRTKMNLPPASAFPVMPIVPQPNQFAQPLPPKVPGEAPIPLAE
jgi:hypothetical protein